MATVLTFTDENLTRLTCCANPENICITITSDNYPMGLNINLDLETSKDLINHMMCQIELFQNYKNNSNE